MSSTACHPATSARERAKALILRTLGVRRIADWCDVGEAAVYQWLSRGTEQEPIPPDRVLKIIEGARAAGLDAPLEILWPAGASTLEVRA
jgi:hypothetical protein